MKETFVNLQNLGYLGSLELRIPWANLKNQPVRVLIEDLFVLAGPLTETEVSFERKWKGQFFIDAS